MADSEWGWEAHTHILAPPNPRTELNKYKDKTLEAGWLARTLYKPPSLTEEGRRNQPHTPQPRGVV